MIYNNKLMRTVLSYLSSSTSGKKITKHRCRLTLCFPHFLNSELQATLELVRFLIKNSRMLIVMTAKNYIGEIQIHITDVCLFYSIEKIVGYLGSVLICRKRHDISIHCGS